MSKDWVVYKPCKSPTTGRKFAKYLTHPRRFNGRGWTEGWGFELREAARFTFWAAVKQAIRHLSRIKNHDDAR